MELPTNSNNTAGIPKKVESSFSGTSTLLMTSSTTQWVISARYRKCFRSDQMYQTDVLTVRIDFVNDVLHIIQSISELWNYIRAIILSWAKQFRRLCGGWTTRRISTIGVRLAKPSVIPRLFSLDYGFITSSSDIALCMSNQISSIPFVKLHPL